MFQEDEDRFKEGESDGGSQGGINVTCTLRRINLINLFSKGLEEEKGVFFIRVLRQEVGWSGDRSLLHFCLESHGTFTSG